MDTYFSTWMEMPVQTTILAAQIKLVSWNLHCLFVGEVNQKLTSKTKLAVSSPKAKIPTTNWRRKEDHLLVDEWYTPHGLRRFFQTEKKGSQRQFWSNCRKMFVAIYRPELWSLSALNNYCVYWKKLEQAKTERACVFETISYYWVLKKDWGDFWKDDIRSVGLFLSEQKLCFDKE